MGKQLSEGLTVRLDRQDREELERRADQQGIGPSTLVRMWIRERLRGTQRPTSKRCWPSFAALQSVCFVMYAVLVVLPATASKASMAAWALPSASGTHPTSSELLAFGPNW